MMANDKLKDAFHELLDNPEMNIHRLNIVTAFMCYDLVCRFFKNDPPKAMIWFDTENPLLGNIKPLDMVLMGKTNQLLKCINDMLSGNRE